ncbi:MAG: glycosyltransferase family 4 protein [Candidatus Pacebacteria bacterium]|jgi:glycosyltransferase involved in cell wall biosynthesis|nr:glycosyltransferase family 4 protein [Candidatus Paceibacterota bacterium]
MKILTNIRFLKVAGIAQTLLSFADFIQKDKKAKDVKFIGVNVEDNLQNGGQAIISKSQEKNFRLISVSMPVPNIKVTVERSANIKDVEKTYEPLIKTYLSIILKEKPDLVLLNGTYYLPWCLYLAAKRAGVKTAVHYHGCLTKETEHFVEHQRIIFHEMEKMFFSDDNKYIFPSQMAKDTVTGEVFKKEIKHFRILPNPIPLHFFNAVKGKRKSKRIGSVGRWTYVKNPHFVEKFALYNARQIKNFTIHIVTDIGAIARLPLRILDIVKVTKPMDNHKLPDFYSKMDLIICPSHFETYGNVAQEAVASGTPALITPTMGVAETFRHFGLDRWIIDFSSPARVAKAMEKTLNETIDPVLRMEMQREMNPQRIHGLALEYLKYN